MNLFELKPGDKVRHYFAGEIINATIIKVDKSGATAKHEPQKWANQTFTETFIKPSTNLQVAAGHAKTTPKAWHNGNELTT